MVIALAAGIVGLGYFGPHPTPAATSPASASPLAAAPTGAPSASPTNAPAPAVAPGTTGVVPGGIEALAGLTGLTQVTPPLDRITTSWLPLQITSRSLGVIGRRLFYIVTTDRIELSVIGSSADPVTVVTVPACEAVNQLAAAGDWLAWVVTSPAGSAEGTSGCTSLGQISWSLWLLDLRGGSPRKVASGVREETSADVAEFPTHVALTEAAYAFDRPAAANDPGQGETVEVHAIDGTLLWSSPIQAPVTDVMLGGSKLAVVTQNAGQGSPKLTLWVSNARQPVLREEAQPATSASLSADGTYLAWDLTLTTGLSRGSAMSDVEIESLASGQITFLTAPTTADLFEPTQPAVASTASGALVAWFATAPEGTVYPAFRLTRGGGGLLESVQLPVWLHVDGSTLMWVAESSDGWSAMAFAVDLTAVAPK